jgi:hypothetical protein
MVVATALPATPKRREGGCRRVGANVINASAERGGYSKIRISILLPNKIADKSRQDCCCELRESPARGFGIGQS